MSHDRLRELKDIIRNVPVDYLNLNSYFVRKAYYELSLEKLDFKTEVRPVVIWMCQHDTELNTKFMLKVDESDGRYKLEFKEYEAYGAGDIEIIHQRVWALDGHRDETFACSMYVEREIDCEQLDTAKCIVARRVN